MSVLKPVVAIDSSVFIAAFMCESGRVESCRAGFESAKRGSISAIISAIVHLEVTQAPLGTPAEKVDGTIRTFLMQPWIATIQVDRSVAELARQLIRDEQLKSLDALHLATAIIYGAKQFWTFDGPLINRRHVRGVVICPPKGQFALPLPIEKAKAKKG